MQSIAGPDVFIARSNGNGKVLLQNVPSYEIIRIQQFVKTAGVVSLQGAQTTLASLHGAGQFSYPTCKRGTIYCFVGVRTTGSKIMYQMDTSTMAITTYPIGVYAISLSAGRQFTLAFTGQIDSVFSISDYSSSSSNILGVTSASGTYTGDSTDILVPNDVLYFVTSV